MPKISLKTLELAITQFKTLDSQRSQLQKYLDVSQPKLVRAILSLKDQGANTTEIKTLMDLLSVLQLSGKECTSPMRAVSAIEFEQEIGRLNSIIDLSRGQSAESMNYSIHQYLAEHREYFALGYGIHIMQKGGFFHHQGPKSSLLILAGLALVSCLTNQAFDQVNRSAIK